MQKISRFIRQNIYIISIVLVTISSFSSGFTVGVLKDKEWQKEVCRDEGGRWSGSFIDTKTSEAFVICHDENDEQFLLYIGQRHY